MCEECGKHGHHHYFNIWEKDGRRHVFYVVMAIVLLISLAVFITYLVLRPTKPTFVLRDTTVSAFNLSCSPVDAQVLLLTSTFQVTLCSRNPTSRVGVFYDRLRVYASYRSQQITLSTALPPSYQGEGDVALWSPFLSGTEVPVAPYLKGVLERDEGNGVVGVSVKVDGRVRWKVGSWVSGGYGLNVDCPFVLAGRGIGSSVDGGGCGGTDGCLPVLRFQQSAKCSVSV